LQTHPASSPAQPREPVRLESLRVLLTEILTGEKLWLPSDARGY
jgi:hypothetical protein